jgi:chromosome segregation ATPase
MSSTPDPGRAARRLGSAIAIGAAALIFAVPALADHASDCRKAHKEAAKAGQAVTPLQKQKDRTKERLDAAQKAFDEIAAKVAAAAAELGQCNPAAGNFARCIATAQLKLVRLQPAATAAFQRLDDAQHADADADAALKAAQKAKDDADRKVRELGC